jgi:hypothetical protein
VPEFWKLSLDSLDPSTPSIPSIIGDIDVASITCVEYQTDVPLVVLSQL